MLKEERELRDGRYIWHRQSSMNRYYKDITALVRAVREDCAKVAEELHDKTRYGALPPVCESYGAEIAAAIRGRK